MGKSSGQVGEERRLVATFSPRAWGWSAICVICVICGLVLPAYVGVTLCRSRPGAARGLSDPGFNSYFLTSPKSEAAVRAGL